MQPRSGLPSKASQHVVDMFKDKSKRRVVRTDVILS